MTCSMQSLLVVLWTLFGGHAAAVLYYCQAFSSSTSHSSTTSSSVVAFGYRTPPIGSLWQPRTRYSSQDNVDRTGTKSNHILAFFPQLGSRTELASSTPSGSGGDSTTNSQYDSIVSRLREKNAIYVNSLYANLESAVENWMLFGSVSYQEQAYNILNQIEAVALDGEQVIQARRRVMRSGLPLPFVMSSPDGGEALMRQDQDRDSINNDDRSTAETMQIPAPTAPISMTDTADHEERRVTAEERLQWEQTRLAQDIPLFDKSVGLLDPNVPDPRITSSSTGITSTSTVANINKSTASLQNASSMSITTVVATTPSSSQPPKKEDLHQLALGKVSRLIAQAGSGLAFHPETLGIGGLNDVLTQIKRRVWIPLAAPPQLLHELGIRPVRGVLLYGQPGCGKTLLAQSLGQILSPLRPLSLISGPEIMDKFVGSSEKNLREVFNNPPDIYDTYRLGELDGGKAIAEVALHVIIMDEFDAIARTRGGRDQGDAGVARDSVVNQLLSLLDGIQKPKAPTLVIGLTNKRSLIDAALLRPGRFEVQIEVPPPRTIEQRLEILTVHTKRMYEVGRLLVNDGPKGSPASMHIASGNTNASGILSFHELIRTLAEECEGFTGAALAAVTRAAASHALERAVESFSTSSNNEENLGPLADCLVTLEDFIYAIQEVVHSQGQTDWAIIHDSDSNVGNKGNNTEKVRIDQPEKVRIDQPESVEASYLSLGKTF